MKTNRRQPAEWEAHDAVWIGWPSAADLWEEDLETAQEEVAELVRTILLPDPEDQTGNGPRGEMVDLLFRGDDARVAAEALRLELPDPTMVRLHDAPIGDVWLRDTGPIFTQSEAGEAAASAFRFNGWGERYLLPEDDKIAGIIAEKAGIRLRRFDGLVAEGGALETDGEGTFITTRQCLLNANRNPQLNEREIEAVLAEALGARAVIWLGEGLLGDHTDGHVDNLARFIAPGKVVCMRPTGKDDPNTEILASIQKALESARDANGRRLEVITIPSPGKILVDGEPVPASHMNFYLSNQALIMPSYGGLSGDDEPAAEALDILEQHVDREHFYAIDSSALLMGGGSFHCISQQQPKSSGK